MLSSIDVISIFPEMFKALSYGVSGKFLAKPDLTMRYWNPRDYADNERGYIDDRPYGGGPGMVMQASPLIRALEAIDSSESCKDNKRKVVYLSPAGRRFNNEVATELLSADSLTLVCGRYEGVDQRFCDNYVDMEVSLGDFVMSGGELAAMAIIDSLMRFMPGCLGNEDSFSEDSFYNSYLDHSHYTRPEVLCGNAVPGVLLSGDHAKIDSWRKKNALGKTWLQRPDLLAQNLDCNEKQLLLQYVAEYLTKHEEKT